MVELINEIKLEDIKVDDLKKKEVLEVYNKIIGIKNIILDTFPKLYQYKAKLKYGAKYGAKRKNCSYCKCNIAVFSWYQHLKTKKHIKNSLVKIKKKLTK